tara:strand:- start:118 stop:1833 length:1716 start_codon:yes stop_codon:yes gene_type:complete
MRFDGKKPIEFSDETVKLEQDNLEEETKYKLKLDAPSEPASSVSSDEESLDAFADAEGDEELSFDDEKEVKGGNDKPFDDTPFDAGVEADEDEDPEKFIQQLAGKLGTSLRKYNDERGEPDFDLEKYAINSVISATHTAEMDEEDQKDIIKKVKMSGAGDDNDDIDKDLDMDSEEPAEDPKPEAEGDELEEGSNLDPYHGFSDKTLRGALMSKLNISPIDLKAKGDLEKLSRDELEKKLNSLKGNKLEEGSREGESMANSEIPPTDDDYSIATEFKQELKKEKEEEDSENLVGKAMAKSEIKELFGKKKIDTSDLPQDIKDEIEKLRAAGKSEEEIEDEILHPQAKKDGITLKKKGFKLVGEEEEKLYEESWSNPMKIVEGSAMSEDLKYHLVNEIALGESIFRYGSDKHIKLYTEVKDLYSKGLIELNENDEKLIEDFTSQSIIIEGETILLNLIIEDDGEYIIEEATDKYKNKKTNKPSRGASGGKAYKVFVPGCVKETKSNPRGIKKITFGSGGLKAKLTNSKAKKSYNARHGCSKGKHNDKCMAGYWSCRLPRYAKFLGLSGGGTWW